MTVGYFKSSRKEQNQETQRKDTQPGQTESTINKKKSWMYNIKRTKAGFLISEGVNKNLLRDRIKNIPGCNEGIGGSMWEKLTLGHKLEILSLKKISRSFHIKHQRQQTSY